MGEASCKTCITNSLPACSNCANDIYNKDDLETIGGIQYMLCDISSQFQQKVCHLFCRRQNHQTGQCVKIQQILVCECTSDSITTPITPSYNYLSKNYLSITKYWPLLILGWHD